MSSTSTAPLEDWALDINHSDRKGFEGDELALRSITDEIKRIKNRPDIDYNSDKVDESDTQFDVNKLNLEYVSNIRKPISFKRAEYYRTSQNWLGHVLTITNESFTAKLEDMDEAGTYELAQFSIKEISQPDIELFVQGALFYWSVGYSNEHGQVTKKSLIRFKRSYVLSAQEFNDAMDKADERVNDLNWEE